MAYCGGKAKVQAGRHYYADGRGDVAVGWHGTYDPPTGMDGSPILCDMDLQGEDGDDHPPAGPPAGAACAT